jgi:hypothetical protein
VRASNERVTTPAGKKNSWQVFLRFNRCCIGFCTLAGNFAARQIWFHYFEMMLTPLRPVSFWKTAV